MVERKGKFYIFANGFLIFLSVCCILPFLLLVMSSLTGEQSLILNGYSLFPKEFGIDSYLYMLKNSGRIGRAYGITLFVTAFGTSLSLLLTVLTSYPLSRKEFFGRNAVSFYIFFTMLFNGGLVPTYIMYTRYLFIRNTIWALIIPSLLLNAFYVIMMRTYLTSNIPDAVVEAARIDGAGEWRTLFSIVLPMSIPMIATMSLLIGLSYWNDWKNGLYYLTDPRLYSIQNILNRMLQDVQFLKSGAGGAEAGEIIASLPSTGIKMAIAVVGALPVLIVYPFFQKFFVKGITVGSVKG